MKSTIYNIDFKKLIVLLTPILLRKPKIIAWLESVVLILAKTYNQFLGFRESTLYWLSITPQVCYLEKMLNDQYDNTERRIKIGTGTDHPPLILYTIQENEPVVLYQKGELPDIKGNKSLYTEGEASSFSNDFIVRVPASVKYKDDGKTEKYNDDEMKAFLDTYKLADKTYKIQIV